MSEPQSLRLSDVRAVFQLVGECRELWADPAAWRERWFEGASELVGAVATIGGELEGFFHEPRCRLLQVIYTGLDENGRERHQRYLREKGYDTIDPPLEAYSRNLQSLTTHSHPQLIRRDVWQRSVLFNEFFRPERIDDRMLSTSRFSPLEKGRSRLYNGITLYRGLGDRPFSERDRRVIHLLHRELCPLIGTVLATCQQRSLHGLSPRLREVLECFLDGDSEQQVALRLHLSRATVNQYAGMLYRHFRVGNRAELMSYFVRRRPS